MLPKALQIPLCFNPAENPHGKGGLANVWKVSHEGQDVAAKSLRVSLTSDLEQTRRVGGPQPVAFSNKLTVAHTVVLQGGRDMEGAFT